MNGQLTAEPSCGSEQLTQLTAQAQVDNDRQGRPNCPAQTAGPVGNPANWVDGSSPGVIDSPAQTQPSNPDSQEQQTGRPMTAGMTVEQADSQTQPRQTQTD